MGIRNLMRCNDDGRIMEWDYMVDLTMYPTGEIEDGEVSVRPTLRRVEGEWENADDWAEIEERGFYPARRRRPSRKTDRTVSYSRPRKRSSALPPIHWTAPPVPSAPVSAAAVRASYDEHGLPCPGVWTVLGPRHPARLSHPGAGDPDLTSPAGRP